MRRFDICGNHEMDRDDGHYVSAEDALRMQRLIREVMPSLLDHLNRMHPVAMYRDRLLLDALIHRCQACL